MTKNPCLVFRLIHKILKQNFFSFSFREKMIVIQIHRMEKMLMIQFHIMEKMIFFCYFHTPTFLYEIV